MPREDLTAQEVEFEPDFDEFNGATEPALVQNFYFARAARPRRRTRNPRCGLLNTKTLENCKSVEIVDGPKSDKELLVTVKHFGTRGKVTVFAGTDDNTGKAPPKEHGGKEWKPSEVPSGKWVEQPQGKKLFIHWGGGREGDTVDVDYTYQPG